MANHKTKSPDENNFRVMKLLQDNPDMTQRELAEQLGISLGGLNFCLKALKAEIAALKIDVAQADKAAL